VTVTSSRATSGPGLLAGCRDEVLWSSDRTRLRRVWLPGDAGTVLCKEPIGAGALARARHETMILSRLAGLPGVVGLAGPVVADAVVIEDQQGESLAAALKGGRISAARLVGLARELATAVASMHARGVVHRDIKPANVLLVGRRQRVVLIDFDVASMLAEEDPGFVHHRAMAGSLAYMSPEQTGRTGRPIDHRTDLYALGSTLYELATGAPPFPLGDDLSLIHDILLRVPQPLDAVVPACPPALSDIVARLLQKEPDDRYQSAQGLERDLAQVVNRPAERFELGRWDFPVRLTAPSRLVGRSAELAALRAAFDDALRGGPRGLLVAGVAGVGKTALLNELRRPLTAQGGWFVAGQAALYPDGASAGPALQAVGTLARLLLAEPAGQLAAVQLRLAEALGSNASLVVAAMPEFAPLMEVTPVADVEVDAAGRLPRAVVDLIRALATAERPIVLAVDELQWADPVSLGVFDALLTEPGLTHLLVVGAYRGEQVDAAHPLTALLARWEQLGSTAPPIRLANLPSAQSTTMLADLLRLAPEPAGRLGSCLQEHAKGNPFDTMELVNALRRDDLLRLEDTGWSWDDGAIRRYVARGDVLSILRDRLARLPEATRSLLRTMACLSGEVPAGLLAAAADVPVADLAELLGPALEDGLLNWQRGDRDEQDQVLRFCHDRVQQAAYEAPGGADHSGQRLALARRLAADPRWTVPAAEQYLAAGATVSPVEQRRIAGFATTAAECALRAGNHTAADRFLTFAADHLTGATSDADALLEVRIRRHAVRYSLGRLADADTEYALIARSTADPVVLTGPASVQISSLTQRKELRAALDLGLDLLERLGQVLPDDFATEELPGRIAELTEWAAGLDLGADLARPEADRPEVLAAAQLFNRLSATAYFLQEQTLNVWMVSQGQRMWADHGPAADLAALLGVISPVVTPQLGDIHLAQTVGRHVLGLCAERGYEPLTSVLRHRQSLHVMPWTEPLERSIEQAALARAGLLRGDDLQMAGHTAFTLLSAQLECSRTIDTYAEEIAATEAFTVRSGHAHALPVAAGHQVLLARLFGDDGPGDGVERSEQMNPYAAGTYHAYCALAAALFGDAEALQAHSAAATARQAMVAGYTTALIRLVRALSLADSRRRTGNSDGDAEFETCRDYLVASAATAPDNFAHLVALVEAEWAWAGGDFRGALTAYDRCRKLAAAQQRPWHQAYAAERLGRFQLAHGLDDAAHRTLADARKAYAAWGAGGKVAQLNTEFPALRAVAPGENTTVIRASPGTDPVRADMIDTLALLRASQAISSETNPEQLHHTIEAQLATLTGASEVTVVVAEDTGGWYVPADERTGGEQLSLDAAVERGLLPLSAVRYVQRTAQPLLVEDVTRDDRFHRDPWFTDLDRCSLLAVPVMHHGNVQAILVLTRKNSNAAFTADRLDAVKLITGQLVISVETARLYASLEARVTQRTLELEAANQRLEQLSATDPLTGVANRRSFEQVLAKTWAATKRSGLPFAMVMLDIDFFKLFNDGYGHLAGDECLARVAQAMAGSVRATDHVSRYGGEEFALILENAPARDAARVAEQVRAAIEALQIPHERGVGGVVTVSVGVAAWDGTTGESPPGIFARADGALYAAKKAGRNQVCFAAPH
jgi:diguanylate cyclase (GGDEF)-like protein